MGRTPMKKERSPERDLAVLYLSMTLTRIGFGVIIILFPAYLLGVSDIELAVALALYPVLEAFSAIPVGRLCDTRGRKRVFVIALAYVAILMGAIGITRNLYFVATVHALMGIGAAAAPLSSLTLITHPTDMGDPRRGVGPLQLHHNGGCSARALDLRAT